ncbi:hypothetical protein CBER1_10742 [Cercospora berteroae]|uniref:Uncharacterized protein n=1 Tax=Cercospora berteroae TaxID=357750 RepID=A0A2S6BY00_9PEZI|nr:hypothetical protein CBER1_10742 [Cercospora berteroae]
MIERTSTSRKSLITRGCSAKETSHTYQNEVRVIKKRIRTSSWNQLLHDTTHPRACGDNLFKELARRMIQLQLQIERMTPNLHRWLLPPDDASETQLKIFDAMTRHAMTVPNAHLKQIMNLELSTTASPSTKGRHHFYVRVWTFKIEELKSLLGHFRQDDTYFTELKEWEQEIQTSEACGVRILEVRKRGTCKGPDRPIDCHLEDLESWSSGIYGEFLDILGAWAPVVAANAENFLLPDAFVAPADSANLFTENIEHLLIQSGPFSTTLNR